MPEEQKFKRIILHCSDSEFGFAGLINEWHIERGFNKIGYSMVVCNGYPTNDWFVKGKIVPYLEGSVEVGRAINSNDTFEPFETPASVAGFNTGSFAICMIGKKVFSDKVLNTALTVVRFAMNQFTLTADDVVGHCELDSKKTCPNIDMNVFRDKLRTRTLYGEKVAPKIEVANTTHPESILEKILKFFFK